MYNRLLKVTPLLEVGRLFGDKATIAKWKKILNLKLSYQELYTFGCSFLCTRVCFI